MYVDKNSIIINDINMGDYLIQADFEYNKLWSSDSGRNLAGTQKGTLVGIFPKLVLTYRSLTKDEVHRLAPIFDSARQTVQYYDENKGKEVYITKYNLNYYPDIEKVTYNQIVGKKVLNIPFLGWLIKLIRSGLFSVLCILILFVMFLENKAKMRRRKRKQSKK